MQKSFPSVLPKRVYPVSLRMHNETALRKPAKHEKTIRGKISKRGSFRLLSLKRTTWKQRGDIVAPGRGLQLIKVITPPVISNLF